MLYYQNANVTALKDYSIDKKVLENQLGKVEGINSLRSKGVFDIEELESFEQNTAMKMRYQY